MWRSKKFILTVLLATVVLVGGIGGIALAQTENEDANQPGVLSVTLWDRVTQILQDDGVNITSEQLQDAFVKAQNGMREAALENRLARLVEEGIIGQDEAQAYLEWWQAKPNVLPGLGFKRHGGFPGMGAMRGFGAPCFPTD